jgi:O-antigen ligase
MDLNIATLSPTGRPGAQASTRAFAEESRVNRSLCWAYYAFIFSLPVEAVGTGIPVSVTRFVGYFFFLVALLNPGICFRRIPTAQWWFGAYVCIYALLGLFQPIMYTEEIYSRVFTLVQLMALFWISFNLLSIPRVARGALLTLSVSCALFAAMQTAGIGDQPSDGDEQRSAFLGQNPNQVANYFAMALVALVGLVYSRNARLSGWRPLAWPLLAVLGLGIVQTGSRGGILAAGVGLVTFMLGSEATRFRLRLAMMAGAAIGLIVAFSLFSEANRRRWEDTFATGNLARREQLYPRAWAMFLEKPILGWGPMTHQYELGWRTSDIIWHNPPQRWRDTHNLFLHVATGTGILGLVPFLIATWLCFRTSWRGRKGPDGMLPLALFIAVMVANMSGSWIHFKLLWLILAYALAGNSPASSSEIGVSVVRLRAPIRLRPGAISTS